MRTTNSKKISAALACILSLIATGCEQTSESTGGIPELTTTVPETSAVSETAVPEETTAAPETTETTTEETTTASEETTAPEETTVSETTTPAESSETSETSATEQEWSETERSATMYVIENCYSREKAIIGATPISQHYAGDTVEITAITDTGYYKLAQGGFIHSDYLSEEKPAETTAATTTTAYETDAPETPDDIDWGNSGDSGSSDDSGFSDPGNSGAGSFGEAIETPGYNIKSSSRYAYKQLSAAEQQLYDKYVAAIKNLESVVEVPNGLSSEQVLKVYTIVYDNEPQLFWMGNSISAGTSFATLSYKTTDRNEISSMQSEISNAASSIINKANKYSGTVSKLKVFFDTIVLQSEFSKSESGYNCSIYNGLTAKGAIQCAGYAKTMQYLCDLAGIESCVVRGSDKDGNSHAWNVVYCENGYYNLDSTWGDPVNSFGSSYIQYEFFLVPDSWIHNITHYNVSCLLRSSGAVKLFTPPACSKEACNYFAAYNKLYDTKADAEAAMYAAIDEAIAEGKHVAEVRVSSKDIYDTLMSDDYFRTFQKYAKGKSSNVKQIQRQKSFTSGVQVIHYDIVYN